MPITSKSSHGHEAIFHSPTATPADLQSITWTEDSIHVPSASPLNAPADVWFNVATSLPRAERWCNSRKVTFLGLWRDSGTQGFGFRVEGFSRYRYVDSDEEAPPRRGVKAEIDDDDFEISPPPLKEYRTVFDVPRGHDDDAVLRLRSALFDKKKEDVMDDVRMTDSVSHETIPEEERLTEVFIDFGDDIPKPERPTPSPMPIYELPYPVYESSIGIKREGLFLDTGLMLGRTTRASFSKGSLAKFHYHTNFSASKTGFAVKLKDMYGHLQESVAHLMRIHCTAWFPTRSEKNEICSPYLVDAFRSSEVADTTIKLLVDELWNAAQAGDQDSRHARVVFWLILALYKGGEEIEVEGDCLIRRLAEWAEGEAGTLFDERPIASDLRKALLHLCVGRVEDAVEVAMEAGFMRLGMLISRALENPKEDLRLDAEAQLAIYGFIDVEELDNPDLDQERWDEVLVQASPFSPVSIDERMILLILAGHVGSVARFMDFSWYRLFILELLYGAGSSDLTQPERVAAAVQAIEKGKIETIAPHAETKDVDAAYHLLRLYADPTTTYTLTSGVYSTGSFGMKHRPLDSRFAWLMHQVFSSLIPEAGLNEAQITLSDGFATQLRAGGMPLWAFYVLCSGKVSHVVLKETILRDWPEMVGDRVRVAEGAFKAAKGVQDVAENDEVMGERQESEGVQENEAESDTLEAELFLTKILRVPVEWIYEAKALSARMAGDKLEECRCWILSRSEEGTARAHELLSQEVVPEVIIAQDSERYETVAELLRDLAGSKHVSNWHSSGDLLLSYLERIIGVPQLRKSDMLELRSMAAKLPSFAERADSHVQRHAACIMADGIATAQRALSLTGPTEGREGLLAQLREDVERLPCSAGVRKRLLGEYDIERSRGRSVATRLSSALTSYSKFVASDS